MKKLLLIRHGKSDWGHPGVPDHDRVLNERGLRDAPRMGQALKKRGIVPDRIVSSTATRSVTTASMVAEGLGYPFERIVTTPDLYLAPPQTILRVVQSLEETAGTVLIFGHNPGMHEAVNLFCPSPELEDFPTLAVAWVEFAADYWGSVEWESGRLREFLIPRSLAEEGIG
jgi:phosphohistidine phosphatase